jgi:hypothetical protein
MKAFFFGAAARRLYGVCHAPASGAGAGAAPAVLLCGPHGQESIRAHRFWRVLAERLARAGSTVLRFDPFGSGDAAGDDQALDLAGWSADVQAASMALQGLSGGRPQVWIGARLGATAALVALSKGAPVPVKAWLACEPVLDGTAWLHELAEATVRSLEASHSVRDPAWRRRLRADPLGLAAEGLGFAIGPRFMAELQALRPVQVPRPSQPGQVFVPARLAGPADADRHAAARAEALRAWQAAAAHHAPGTGVTTLDYQFDWFSETALGTAIVPAALLQALVTAVQEAERCGGGLCAQPLASGHLQGADS